MVRVCYTSCHRRKNSFVGMNEKRVTMAGGLPNGSKWLQMAPQGSKGHLWLLGFLSPWSLPLVGFGIDPGHPFHPVPRPAIESRDRW